MKKSYITAAVAVVVIGLAGVQQVRFQHQVEQQVEQLVRNMNTYDYTKEFIHANLLHQESGLFASSGTMVVTTKEDKQPSQFEIAYTVHHGPTALLTGARYEVDITNTLLEGDNEETLTSVFFQDKPITVRGSMRSDSTKGVFTIPEVNFTMDNNTFVSAPVVTNFEASRFNAYGNPDQYTLNGHLPSFLATNDFTTADITNVRFSAYNDFTKKGGRGGAETSLEALQIVQDNEQVLRIEDMTFDTELKIKRELVNTFHLAFETLEVLDYSFTNGQFDQTLKGIDGPAMLDIVDVAEQAQYEQWEESEMIEGFLNVLKAHADTLIAQNPTYKVDRLHAHLNGELFVQAEGALTLNASKLPDNFMRNILESKSDISSALQAANAVEVNVQAEFGEELAATIAHFNPELAAMLANFGEKLTFELKDGQPVLNGESL